MTQGQPIGTPPYLSMCCLSGSERSEGSASSMHEREHADAQQQRSAVEEAAARRTLGFKEAFWLATMGGAHALGLQVCPCYHRLCSAWYIDINTTLQGVVSARGTGELGVDREPDMGQSSGKSSCLQD